MSNDYFSSANNSANCSSSRWLTEEVFKLIDIVQKDEAIYNPRHKYYFCRPYVENFWREVDLKLEKNPGASLAKWTNLRISFRREYTNYLEEKLPPCWTYFDRMFFLHPYLRKKQPQTKSLDSQVQDALVHINSISTHLQRERVAASTAGVAAVSQILTQPRSVDGHPHSSTGNAENYLEYFDNPEANNSELDDIIDNDEQNGRFQQLEANSLNNDIKSECDEAVEEFDEPPIEGNKSPDNADDEHDNDEVLNFAWDSMASSSNSSAFVHSDRRFQRQHIPNYQQQRLEHLQRLQTRNYHEELRAKRPRSNESISSTHTCHQRSSINTNSNTSAQPNVSFVRPTLTTKPAEVVSTTTTAAGNYQRNGDINEQPTTTIHIASSSVSTQPTASRHASQQIAHQHHQQQRNETNASNPMATALNKSTPLQTVATANIATGGSSHAELCDCKIDPDAMFLMSLLPDIQKLNGRDRGKIKIAFQNILQDYLYPD